MNCSGVGARSLVPDPELTPIRGQLVSVRNPGITTFFTEDTGESEDLLHIYPHGETVVLGGVAITGDWSLEPDALVSNAVRKRVAAVEPLLGTSDTLDVRVGLRPTRSAVRLESVNHNHGSLIHCYGHGGAGVSLSWGCALEVRRMAEASSQADH